ncbi:DUF1206 domain-containing protein [Microbacterium terricola]|uniref:DUF1206 domain-containing protein n=1 Tax=Microbacterium terricola TaxID=344163 RepID=A0ABM8DX64_9MICO|nr:DUF1206 domain-containing protein [Microbacterium terricola]UYK39094.1 DUF1206 domain-containing protein [Microbacterium terricola]BDV30195.1 hypothetical protein Microterr_08550 [Microbacterium terricola]
MTDSVKDAAREAESSRTLHVLARAGYAANGLVHVLIGVLVLVVAFGGRSESDQAGAFKAVAAAPLGFAVLWVLAIALWALALWHAVEGVLAPARGGDAKGLARKWGVRVSEWGQALVFAALGVIAAAVALGARPDADEAAQGASRGVLAIPGGPFLLGAVGLGVGIGGVVFVVMGVRRSFENKMSIPSSPLGDGVKILGIVGFIAKGIALVVVGVLLLVSAVTVDPDAAAGLDGAIQALFDLPYGAWLAGVVGAGIIAYGVFCFFRAGFARL